MLSVSRFGGKRSSSSKNPVPPFLHRLGGSLSPDLSVINSQNYGKSNAPLFVFQTLYCSTSRDTHVASGTKHPDGSDWQAGPRSPGIAPPRSLSPQPVQNHGLRQTKSKPLARSCLKSAELKASCYMRSSLGAQPTQASLMDRKFHSAPLRCTS
jgi:hypothetical protein